MEEHLEFEQEGRTELSQLGEFPLIQRLSEGFETVNASTVKGIGDDCAVLGEGDKKTVVTIDSLVEGINFDMMYTPLRHLGYKATTISLSNIAAMNARPKQVLVSLAVSNRYSVEALEEFYAGIRLCCQRYGVDMVGGAMNTTTAGMTITITGIGEAEKDKITYRSGAKKYDLICCSGDLGSAYAGLLILEREKATYQANPKYQPDLDTYDYVLERFLKPEPRLDIVDFLAQKDIVPTSMIDVSDGLASELLHICRESSCGCQVYEERLPIDYQTTRVCTEMNKKLLPTSCALNGGSDYELLFTINQKDYDKIKDSKEIHVIGHITEKGSAAEMVTPQSTVIPLKAQGWQGNC
ncbi:MAG: thiamine-phosphate kinase [Bacteroidales bacterium]|nr:thiamine-phosphate kinase [Bacteroidales bacterium]